MTSPAITVAPETHCKDAAALLVRHRISALPVVDPEGRLLGIVSETDLVTKEEWQPREELPPRAGRARRRQRAKALGTTAADFMSAPVVTVAPGASLGTATRLLHRHDVRHLPVVDPRGRLVGIVARRDLLSVFLHADGDIRDEIAGTVLHATFNLPAGAVRVEVHEGVAALSGRVPWRSTAREVVDRVRALDGVVDVVDRLSWSHDDTATSTSPR